MFSGYHETTDASDTNKYFGQSVDKKWMLGIGSKFGVTSEGTIYASDAYITVNSGS